MAWSKCPHCNGGYFELVGKEPANAAYKLQFVQCSSCGAPFGVTEYYNLGQLLKKQEEAVADLGQRLRSIEHSLHQIAQAMRR
jgi:transposase-like protein